MNRSPKRVLHVVRGMVNAGVETWLMHALRQFDRRRVRTDFLVHTAEPCAYDTEIEDRQSRLFRCTVPLHSPMYAQRVRKILETNGPFDVVHSHVHHFSGYLLSLAKSCGVPIRIAHSHSDTRGLDRQSGWVRRGYLKLMRKWIQRHATNLVGASIPAGDSLFGRGWIQDPRSKVLYCGMDFNGFPRGAGREAARSAIRSAWNIGEHEFVIGHVGRFAAPKNHQLLLRVAAEVMRRQPCARLLLVGDGPLRGKLVELAGDLGIASRVIFAGIQQQIPQFLSAMDVFVFPSLHEGLGLALVEAQAAGIPCVVSNTVPDEADVVRSLVHRLSLDSASEDWADAVIACRRELIPGPAESLSVVEASAFQITRSLEPLYSLYAA